MKWNKQYQLTLIWGVFLLTTLVIMGSCAPKKDKGQIIAVDEKMSKDTINQTTLIDTAVHTPQPSESSSKKELQSNQPPVSKVCSPNFTLIGKGKTNHYFYYVTGFNPAEFKCWAELETHGQKIADGRPCIIYYVDIAKLAITSSPPHFVDINTLQQHGIGRFEHTEHWWEVKGAKIWGRQGKELTYYNTNNNAGG